MSGINDVTPSAKVLRLIGRPLAAAMLDWSAWVHRKVESLSLLEGERARRRVSVDCSPVPIPWPDPSKSSRALSQSQSTQSVVPLALMRKGPIRDLDVVGDSGQILPVLTRSENALLAAAAMLVLIEASVPRGSLTGRVGGRRIRDAVWSRVWGVAHSEPVTAEAEARSLVVDFGLNETVEAIMMDLADNFVLCALIPSTQVGRRQVIKFSYHWDGVRRPSLGYYLRLAFAGIGYCSTRMLVEVPGVETANSYHLEVPAPLGLLVSDISPSDRVAGRWPAPGPIGHAHASRDYSGKPVAAVYLRLAGSGLLTTMFLYLVLAAGLLSLMRFYPEALENAAMNTDAVTALVTLAPALLFGLASRRSESSIVSRLLLPLRSIAGLLSAYFLGLSALLIFAGQQTVTDYVRWGLNATVLLGLLVGTGRTLTWLSTHIAPRDAARERRSNGRTSDA